MQCSDFIYDYQGRSEDTGEVHQILFSRDVKIGTSVQLRDFPPPTFVDESE